MHTKPEDLMGFSGTGVLVTYLVDAAHEVLPGLRLATFLTGRRRTLGSALEETLNSSTKTHFAIVALGQAVIEDGERPGNALVATCTGWHPSSIGSRVEDGRELCIPSGGVIAAALEEQHGGRENRKSECAGFYEIPACRPQSVILTVWAVYIEGRSHVPIEIGWAPSATGHALDR
jgi:hypothetical protein